ncbi:MAG: septum formation protein Maf [Deltaproteobacteria bacterium]|nr:MAG: septum formation protein Maf [Deltaproteobacteria bacterium]
MGHRLVLASASPRRRELLERAGYRFEIEVADVDETFFDGEHPVEATVRVACEKALAVAAGKRSGVVVLGADTTVVCDGRILGKPADPGEAADMLLSIAGRDHTVFTGWALAGCDEHGAPSLITGVARSVVSMRSISRQEAEQYASSGEPLDKAGGYAVQGEGRRFVSRVVGPLDNVIGLPVDDLAPVLAEMGIEPERA